MYALHQFILSLASLTLRGPSEAAAMEAEAKAVARAEAEAKAKAVAHIFAFPRFHPAL